MLILFLMFYFTCLIADFGRSWFFQEGEQNGPLKTRTVAKIIPMASHLEKARRE